MTDWQGGPTLVTCSWLPQLVRDHLHDDASSAMTFGPDRRGPVWSTAWFDRWSRNRLRRASVGAERQSVEAQLTSLADGADVVITGQQPGFLGGPLYTLLKAATCLSLAGLRSAAGRPTVALFWCGDDDDDVSEALDVDIWDPRRRTFLRPAADPRWQGYRLGALPASVYGRAELAWLSQYSRIPSAQSLAGLWSDALAGSWTWGRLHARALEVMFAGQGLLTVSGDDPDLMEVGRPILTRMIEQAPALAQAVRKRGVKLVTEGHHAQIGERSLERPFHEVDGDRRLGLETAELAGRADLRGIRCGVMLRSPLQDWLFQPAGVVVGPGERSYLEQLLPVYETLGIARSPMVPRLHLSFTPEDHPAELGPTAADLDQAATRVIKAATGALTDELNRIDPALAHGRAERAAQKWRTTVHRALAEGPWSQPGDRSGSVWRNPPSGRAERALPSCWGAALLPDPTKTLLAMSSDHLRRWSEGEAREYLWLLNDGFLEGLG